MVVVEIYRGLLLALLGILACEFLVEEVGGDVVDVDEADARLLHYLPIPAAARQMSQPTKVARPCMP